MFRKIVKLGQGENQVVGQMHVKLIRGKNPQLVLLVICSRLNKNIILNLYKIFESFERFL